MATTDLYQQRRGEIERELAQIKLEPMTAENARRIQQLQDELRAMRNQAIVNADSEREADDKAEQMNLGGQIGSSVGTIAGSALIPIPGVGGMIGGLAGGVLGGLFGRNKRPKFEFTPTGVATEGASYQMGGMLPDPSMMDPAMMDPMAGAGMGAPMPMGNGGMGVPIGQDAMRVEGPSHAGGGVPVPGTNAEVEGGETMDDVGGNTYVFSDELEVPGTSETFAEFHERMVQEGASPAEVDALAALQERERANTEKGHYVPTRKMNLGGIIETLAPYAGDIVNIGAGLFGSRNTPDPTMVDPTAALTLRNRRVDTTPEANRISAMGRGITVAPGTSRADRLATHANTLNALVDLGSARTNAEANNLASGTEMYQNIVASNAAFQTEADREAAAMRTAREAQLMAGLAGLGNTFQNIQRDAAQGEMQGQAYVSHLIDTASSMPEGSAKAFMESGKALLDPAYHHLIDQYILSRWGGKEIPQGAGVGVAPSAPTRPPMPGLYTPPVGMRRRDPNRPYTRNPLGI